MFRENISKRHLETNDHILGLFQSIRNWSSFIHGQDRRQGI